MLAGEEVGQLANGGVEIGHPSAVAQFEAEAKG